MTATTEERRDALAEAQRELERCKARTGRALAREGHVRTMLSQLLAVAIDELWPAYQVVHDGDAERLAGIGETVTIIERQMAGGGPK